MEGRRVNRTAPKRNPLYVMFLCLVAAVFVLLIVVIVLGAKLGATQKSLKAAETQIEELQKKAEQATEPDGRQDGTTEPDDKLPGEDMPAIDPSENTTATDPKKVMVGWLDLTGHNEVSVLPEKVFSEYAAYYTTAGVNLRGGPSTSHSKIQLVDKGTKVKAAAKDGNWTFVSVGSKFGWISSDYLSTNPPAEATSGSLKKN